MRLHPSRCTCRNAKKRRNILSVWNDGVGGVTQRSEEKLHWSPLIKKVVKPVRMETVVLLAKNE